MDKFHGKYRIPSARAPWWDYGQNGFYFITICTKNRECFHDHIIRNQQSYNRITDYIIHNPKNWNDDEFII